MRPAQFSAAGFLGRHERLVDVLEADARALSELGVGAGLLSDRLARLLDAATQSRRGVARIDPFTIRIRRYKGVQICPFAPQPFANPCPGATGSRFASLDWEIRNRRNGVELSGPGLIVHLIGAHGFFEGIQSPYRVPPRALAELLELGPFAPSSS